MERNEMMVYLDNSATTKQYKEVTDAMVECMVEDFGNPSSMHRLGINAEKKVKNARNQVASALGVKADEIIFTSGGTESDNTAIFGAAYAKKRRGNRLITSQVEHPAVLEAFKKLEEEGFEVVYLPVDENCQVSLEDYKNAIDDKTIFTSIMTVNNEVGTIMPIKEMYAVKPENSWFHTDAVQAFGKMKVPVTDMISLSGHKIHGPKGIGALYVGKGVNIKPFLVGGGQEKHMRSGTENVPAIVGLGQAASMIKNNNIGQVKEHLLNGIKAELKDIKVNSPEQSLDNILNISFLGTRSEVILHTLEQDGIYVSAGSACSSNKKGRSHVLAAMGLKDNEIEGAIRFSLNEFNTIEEMDYVIDKVKNAVTRFRKLGSFR